jgi:sialate O-acetylesterase
MQRWLYPSSLFVMVFTSLSARADVAPAKVFGNNMVLQRGMKVPVWGKAAAGEKVTVTLLDQKKTTKADKKGNWSVKLDELKAGGPYEMTVSGNKNTVTFKNVLVGEVWVCSGQSNMQWTIANTDKEGKSVADAKLPELRLNSGTWLECTPETAHKFSATAYYFGRDLQKALGMPVGLINRSVGGTSARLWTSKSAIEAAPAMKPFLADLFPKDKGGGIGNLYEGNIRPLIPYAMRGVIWYQGESDANRPEEYTHLFKTLIRSWRADWGQGDFPFLFAHLGAIGGPVKDANQVGWGPIREAQSAALELPATAVAAFHDSDADLHPRRKDLVGARLALAARAIAYGEKIVYSGPAFDGVKFEGDKAIVSFKHVGGGLVVKGESLKGFAVAGKDGKFVMADAKIEGDKVVVSSKSVSAPAFVRYAFASNPQATLYNREDLPALPFRTDGKKK